MEKVKGFLLGFIFLFLIVSVSAQQPSPPVQTNINTNIGLQIEFTQVSTFKNGEDHLFNAHVFNISTGLRVDNTTTDCTYHLFNNTGQHQIEQRPMIFSSVGGDWDFNVLGENFTRNGGYSYLVVCNTTNLGGFLSAGFEVTPSGRSSPTTGEGIIFISSLISMLLIASLFFLYSNSFQGNPAALSGSKEAKGNPAARFVFLSLSFIVGITTILYSSVALMETFWGFDKILNSYSAFLYINLVVLFIMFIFILLHLTIRVIEAMKTARGLE